MDQAKANKENANGLNLVADRHTTVGTAIP